MTPRPPDTGDFRGPQRRSRRLSFPNAVISIETRWGGPRTACSALSPPRLPFPRLAGQSCTILVGQINCTLRPPRRSSAQSFLAVPRLPPASPDAGIGTPGRGRTWHRWAKPPFLHFHGESTPSFGISNVLPSRLRGRGTEDRGGRSVAVSHALCQLSRINQEPTSSS
ncbi:hypothetical protein BGZ61DRAFT_448182 [Ilyonectria robusta]|uniref:uncharacterized protein n=1 Tax=Ilyonectria robusta TaxID=1079257 RepID=UPI001E8D025E|nr:uncharacterized protein BGZ61DRAFT_448182 [Ilyonectria robusta]KAH8722191.1 hypothetical protein BGZ61DRAFT_448182 [Ilyonectria robusta]